MNLIADDEFQNIFPSPVNVANFDNPINFSITIGDCKGGGKLSLLRLVNFSGGKLST